MNSLEPMRAVRIGMLGFGTVGRAVQELIFKGDLNRYFGRPLKIVKIYTPHPRKKNLYRKRPTLFTTNAKEVTDNPEIDIILEVLGSNNERELRTFKELIIRAFRNGKSVVTSDKAVLARYSKEIWSEARRYRKQIRFEACVGASIPIIRSLTESLVVEEPEAIYGIINGTCNYILSKMSLGESSYEESLREAKKRGCAETNPTADTSGRDAESKLFLLAAVTFGIQLKSSHVWRQGIDMINPLDFYYANHKGFCNIKHIAVSRKVNGVIESFVSPALVPKSHYLSSVDGMTNALFFKGKRTHSDPGSYTANSRYTDAERDWDYVFMGPGAGGGPTATALLGDVYNLVQHSKFSPILSSLPFAHEVLALQPKDLITLDFYIRFVVRDRSGIVGDICQIFGEKGINVSEVWQLNHGEDDLRRLSMKYNFRKKQPKILPFVITLERTTVGQVKKALGIIKKKRFIEIEPVCLPIWEYQNR